ncbi:MAG: amidohydrolase family protein [Candidatus Nitrohelix vancouverensis]|uniref:Amidohydrolase family protein n=1 Tax=Candidatus Nitrohelix vancouverensis TaxID=2705534 RepID=A0A7T0G400_9BACT|nr:MAG: amidohydrolase family protein [Candidatus Nitrohelix vancouverensis]
MIHNFQNIWLAITARSIALSVLALASLFLNVAQAETPGHAPGHDESDQSILLKASRIFDGNKMHSNAALLIDGNKIAKLGPSDSISDHAATVVDLGDSTILPGFIELHSHIVFQHVPRRVLLEHGVTTARDVGGDLLAPSGGQGVLRLLSSGPILTAKGGYPLSVFGHGGHHHGSGKIAIGVETEEQARQAVRHLIEGGASFIKIALEPGGEPGAPWTMGHHGGVSSAWPLLSLEIVKAIVDEAHSLKRRVTAHVSEDVGVALALDAGVDEWAHVPCMKISDALLKRAVQQDVKIVSTLDTLSACHGIHHNAKRLAELGADFYYGAEVAHVDIPWGIDARELQLMHQLTGMTALELFHTATAKAGRYLGLEPLGQLTPGAPADLIAVRGNALHNLKRLEYPDLVMSGGHWIVNNYSGAQSEPESAPHRPAWNH